MRVIIDCDPGNGVVGANVDDGLALALAIAAPEIKLEMITTVSGNTPSEIGFDVASHLVYSLGENIPVYRGASSALVETSAPWRELLDNGAERAQLTHLWDGLPSIPSLPKSIPEAALRIGELVCQNPKQVTIIAIGPLTNIAIAMQLFPDMAQNVAEIVIMGAVFNVPGYLKDTNFGVDPEAAYAVLNSGANLTLVPMDVTVQTQMVHEDLDKLAQIDTPLSRFLVATMRPWMDYSRATRHLAGCWIHDVLTVAWLLDKGLVTYDKKHVGIELQGALRGKSFCYDALRLRVGVPEPKTKPITVLQSVDNSGLLDLIFNTLKLKK
ncbi:nucleoside hydrolase [Providencia rettgeri]|uniref:Nucleoside hydrolase n=1 Tax=Providencia rettgeri TaxID=587 RepID=A0AAW6UAP9_PRORE|nr:MULTISPECIES: nucleoside hydrolase [Providencia]MBG5893577.1 nucleoside hydrolase [Providencia rettgeri]MBQ0529157.1 nucleoside hydrolase [Providencia rettgeri]MDI9092239.1 nucleoside hydrolase [Providencia rettgeri]MDT2037701.1 nucleoside hydrolase [Providencia rettgeri]THB29441.1 nucleoside hydrolase [Providencia sp. MGF014]